MVDGSYRCGRSGKTRTIVRKFFGQLFVVVSMFGVLSSIDPGQVEAHAGLKSSEPAASSILEASPKEIVLYFAEQVEVSFGSIRLFNSESKIILLPTPKFASVDSAGQVRKDAKTVRVELPELENGSYLVVWRVVSADSHPVQGAFAFQIGTQGTDLTEFGDEVLASSSAPIGFRVMMGFSRWLSFLGVAVLIGALLLSTQISGASRIKKILYGSWLASCIGALLMLFFQAPYALGRAMGIGQLLASLDDVLKTRLGFWLVVRGVLLLLFLILVWKNSRHQYSVYRMSAVLIVICLLATFSISGHPGMRQFSALSIGTDIVHFLSVSAWMGGLLTIVLLGRKWQSDSPRVISWFSLSATISMPIMVATGVAQAWRMMEGLQNIFSTSYGVILSTKVLFVLVAIAAGTRARQLFKSKQVESRDLKQVKFAKTIITESAIGVVVLAVTAILVAVPPLSVGSNAPFTATLVEANVIADVRMTPARVGEIEVHVVLSPPGGSLQKITELSARISLVKGEIPAIPIDLKLVGTNHFQAKLLMPRAGDWLLEIFLQPSAGQSLRFSSRVLIGK